MDDNRDFLGTEPVKKLLFRLAIPSVVAQIINLLYNIIDRIYIGHIPEYGSLALTGVGVCMPIILIVSAFASLVSSGGAPRASIAMGRNDLNSAEKILGNCFSLLIVLSVFLTAAVLLFNRDALLVFGASENTIDYASSYMSVYAMGTVFVQLTLGLNAFINAQGFTKTGMITTSIGAICNIVLDPLFIFTFGMGVKGAALATIISQAVSCIWCIVFLRGMKTRLRIRRENLRIEKDVILPCLALGSATFTVQASESIISVCFNSSLLKYGGDIAVGAMTICSSIFQFVMLPMTGIGMGAQPISSYNYGAGNASRVKETFRLLLKVCVIYSLVVYAVIMIAPQAFARIFTSDRELIDFAATAIRIYNGALFIFGIQIACQMTLMSTGNAKSSIIVAAVRKFVLLIPMIYLMPLLVENKTLGVYMAEPVADMIAVTFTAVLFFFQFRKAVRGIDATE